MPRPRHPRIHNSLSFAHPASGFHAVHVSRQVRAMIHPCPFLFVHLDAHQPQLYILIIFRPTTCVSDISRPLCKNAYFQLVVALFYALAFGLIASEHYWIERSQGCSDSGDLLRLGYATMVFSAVMSFIFFVRSFINIVRSISIFACVSPEIVQRGGIIN